MAESVDYSSDISSEAYEAIYSSGSSFIDYDCHDYECDEYGVAHAYLKGVLERMDREKLLKEEYERQRIVKRAILKITTFVMPAATKARSLPQYESMLLTTEASPSGTRYRSYKAVATKKLCNCQVLCWITPRAKQAQKALKSLLKA